MHGDLKGQRLATDRELSQGRQVTSIFKLVVINSCTLITQAETKVGQTGSGCLSVTKNIFCKYNEAGF